MDPLYEGVIIGALTGVILLGVVACWFGVLAAYVISAAQFNGADFLKIAGAIINIGIVGGTVVGGSVGLISRFISPDVEGTYIAVFAGAAALGFGGFIVDVSGNSNRQMKFGRAITSGTLGLIVGGILGGVLGSIVALIRNAVK